MAIGRLLAASASASLLAVASASAMPAAEAVAPPHLAFAARHVTPESLARAIKASAGLPRPRRVICRRASHALRAAKPFGNTHRPLFTCTVTTGATHARYVVQVLSSGCFIAEDPAHGRAIYGCGAGRS